MNNQWFSKVAVWLVIALVLFTVFKQFDRTVVGGNQIAYSDFLDEVAAQRIKSVTLQEAAGGSTEILAVTNDDRRLRSTATYLDRGLIGDLRNNNVKFDVKQREEPSLLMSILVSWGPMLLLIGVWIYFMRQMQGGGKGGAFSFGKSKARMLDEANNTTTFQDVAGCDEAKEEVKELVDFLKDPQKFQKLGGRIPRGVLLVGPPGTGKTLLAKAIAGEAKVPFFSISGSDFVEMFVGVGASRVRDLFEQGKKSAPCIIFMDEIDAVGRHRFTGLGGGHDEREQTLNQILVEMDGFDSNDEVILIAATNRPDVLDPALLRPGRFDRRIAVDMPDCKGREAILRVHAKKVVVDKKVDLAVLARRTPGFSGADLANVINEAALLAARRNKDCVGMIELEEAIDRVMAGPEKRSRVMTDRDRRVIAYHESGHAVLQMLIPEVHPLHKVSILPRGMALGYTMQLPTEDRYLTTRTELMGEMTVLLGGRVAEEMVFGEGTNGASNDLERVTKVAHLIISRFGMNEKMGPIVYESDEQQVFLGRDMTKSRGYSEETAHEIDREIRKLVDECYSRARDVITEHKHDLDRLATTLLTKEVMNADEVYAMFPHIPRKKGAESPDEAPTPDKTPVPATTEAA
ncbi:ATP-dependent metallopeptidase FtsH/Yme1/Tma family protein [bacterium]|nr:ATP-dependent metallopeptidase FtsH/Yme1/Tma family protein [bacterium]